MTEQPIPTTERLARALEVAGAPQDMIARARLGIYDDFKSYHATPTELLVQDATFFDLYDIAERARKGEFDATKEESDAWAESPEGQEFLQCFLDDAKHPRPKNPYSSKKKRRQ